MKINKPAFLGPHELHFGKHAGFYKGLSDQTIYTNFSVIAINQEARVWHKHSLSVLTNNTKKKLAYILRVGKIFKPNCATYSGILEN